MCHLYALASKLLYLHWLSSHHIICYGPTWARGIVLNNLENMGSNIKDANLRKQFYLQLLLNLKVQGIFWPNTHFHYRKVV